MDSIKLTPREEAAIQQTRERIIRLGAFFANNAPPKTDTASEWFEYLAIFTEQLGNINNDVSFFATLLARSFLIEHLDVAPFDAAAKAQGARGLDINERTKTGERIIAEIKTTHPYLGEELGGQQKTMFRKDAGKLGREDAEHKFFFLTDRAAFNVMNKPKYRQWFRGVRVVLLPSGEELSASPPPSSLPQDPRTGPSR